MESTLDWFEACGMPIRRTGAEREYAGLVADAEGVRIALLAAGEVPRELAAGRLHWGVTGLDLVRESLPDHAVVRPLAPMGFGRADLVLAVPRFWVDVVTLDDLDAVAADFRARHGHRLRIATKYHRLLRAFLREAGVADYAIVDSQGATEGSVKNGTAEAIADITTTGETLRANHLRILDDGLILESQATLFRAEAAAWGPEERAAEAKLLARMGLL